MSAHQMLIPTDIADKMIFHCRSVYPNEACGILSGRAGSIEKIYEMTNIEPSPVSYYMDPKEQFGVMKDMRDRGTQMVAIYHSHPGSPAYPSMKDVDLAVYSDSAYVIVSLTDFGHPEIRAFEIIDGRVEEIHLIKA